MKKTWTTEQIVLLLREAESGTTSISELCRQKGISQNSFYKWRQKYGGLEVNQIKRLRELDQENGRLKRLLAEALLDNAILKEVLQKK